MPRSRGRVRMSASATDTTVCRGQTRDGRNLTSGGVASLRSACRPEGQTGDSRGLVFRIWSRVVVTGRGHFVRTRQAVHIQFVYVWPLLSFDK